MRFLSRLIFRPSYSKAVTYSAIVHVGALAAFHYWQPQLESRADFTGQRNALYLQASFSEIQPEVAEQVQVSVVFESATSEPIEQFVAYQQISYKPPELARRDAVTEVSLPSERAAMPVEVNADERPVQVELPQRQSPEATKIKLNRQAESSQPPARSVSAPAIHSTAAVEEIAGLDEKTPPNFSGNRPPSYPADAIRLALQGTVVLRLTVSASGQIESVEISRSSGHRILDLEAVQTVSRWRGQPAQQSGLAIATVEILPIHFRLNR